VTTFRDLIRSEACVPSCRLASTAPTRCSCPCEGQLHGLLLDADVTALIDGAAPGCTG
jgi:hypothetical protein